MKICHTCQQTYSPVAAVSDRRPAIGSRRPAIRDRRYNRRAEDFPL